MVDAEDAEIALLRAGLEAALDRERRLELRLAELERRLGMDSTDSGTPSSKERIGAKEARKAFFDMLGVFAEFETNLRKKRQAEGIAAADNHR